MYYTTKPSELQYEFFYMINRNLKREASRIVAMSFCEPRSCS